MSLPRDLAAPDPLLVGPVAAGTDQAGLGADRSRPADHPDGQLRAVHGHQAAHRLGYETLVRKVSDSLHLRRFWLPLTQRVPDESTVRKLVRRLGLEVLAELTRKVGEGCASTSSWASRAAGRAPQAKLLAERLDLEHISVGDIFRWNI
jgi:hypothetical protein